MDMGFGDAPELKIPTIAPKKKRPVIESNDARVAEVNAKACLLYTSPSPRD